MAAVKTVCPITREEFRQHARDLAATIEGKPLVIEVKEFSTGSLGFYANGKVTLEINGKRVTFQLGLSLTAVGSKDLPL
jgi:hypothetical protein